MKSPLSDRRSATIGSRRLKTASVLVAALVPTLIGLPSAQADESAGVPGGFVPSSPPATGTSLDGWTLMLSASGETRTPIASDPSVPPSEVSVGGLFTAALRGPKGAKTPTPSGTMEVGYQTQCIPAGMMAEMMAAVSRSSGVVNTVILKKEFTGVDPSAAVTGFRLPVACMGQLLLRSYAILTRTTDGADSAVAYYGVYTPL